MSGAGPWFHGTRAHLSVGDVLVPGDELGFDHHGLGRSDVVYVTDSIGLAQTYAEVAAGPGVPVVLEVRPHGDLCVDDAEVFAGARQSAFACDSATVVAVHDFI